SYSLRVAALNHDLVATFVTPSGSPALTVAGPAPIAPQIAAVSVSSLSVTWTSVASYSGYAVDASTSGTFIPVQAGTTTADGNASGLAFHNASLAPNTTYYVRAGSLWNGATSYAPT